MFSLEILENKYHVIEIKRNRRATDFQKPHELFQQYFLRTFS